MTSITIVAVITIATTALWKALKLDLFSCVPWGRHGAMRTNMTVYQSMRHEVRATASRVLRSQLDCKSSTTMLNIGRRLETSLRHIMQDKFCSTHGPQTSRAHRAICKQIRFEESN
eukprot:14970499-Heterocapsa_arctica.AAC.1